MTLRLPWPALVAAVLLVGSFGCRGKSAGPPIQSSADFLPDALYSGNAVLDYGGTPVAVTMEREAAPPLVKFVLSAHGQVLETETYRSSSGAFELLSIDESFDPPIPLLKFPMNIGDAWEWKGKLTAGALAHNAEAKVETSQERESFEKLGVMDTVQCEIHLSIDSGAAEPAKRRLTFWFVRGKGIVKREMGTATVRRPAVPSDTSNGDVAPKDEPHDK